MEVFWEGILILSSYPCLILCMFVYVCLYIQYKLTYTRSTVCAGLRVCKVTKNDELEQQFSTFLISWCNWTQVWLPANRKPSNWEAGADVKESSLSRCRPPRRWVTHTSKPMPTSPWRQRFYKEGEGDRAKGTREGIAKLSLWRPAQFSSIRPVMVRYASFWFSRPAFP